MVGTYAVTRCDTNFRHPAFFRLSFLNRDERCAGNPICKYRRPQLTRGATKELTRNYCRKTWISLN